MTPRPFRFGVNDAPGPETSARAQRFEALGYDLLLAPDRPQLPSPLPILAAAAAVTERIGLGTYVLAASLHEPGELVRQLRLSTPWRQTGSNPASAQVSRRARLR